MTKFHTRTGFTIIELLVALVLGVVVVSAMLGFTVSSMQNLERNRTHEEIARSARFIGMSLERDMQETGVSLASTVAFGSLSVRADTVSIWRVPFEPNEARPHPLIPPAGTANPLPAGGTCGANCVNVDTNGEPFDLAVGDIARLQVNNTRHVILVNGVTISGNDAAVSFTADSTLMGYAAGLSQGMLLDRFNTFVQKLDLTVYYSDGTTLYRAGSLKPNGEPDGEPISYGVESWDAWIVFADGSEAENANPYDTDGGNDYDDLLGVKIQAELSGDHPLLRDGTSGVVEGTRLYEWRFAPRNLTYERNRITS